MHSNLVAVSVLLWLCSLPCYGQDQLRVVSSTPLPPTVIHKGWYGVDPARLGCLQDGSFLVAEGHDAWRVSPLISRVSSNGTLLWTVDSENFSGLGRTDLYDFAPGPGGELYVLVKRVVRRYFYRDDKGNRVPGGRSDDPGNWLVRYDNEGRFVDRKPSLAAHDVRIAVFPGGKIFILSYTIQGMPIRVGDPPHPWAVLAGVFSPDGVLLHRVTAPDFFLDHSSGRPRPPLSIPLPILGPDGNVYVVKEGETPALAVISPDGDVLRSIALAVPSGGALEYSRLFGQHLLARMTFDQPHPPSGGIKTSLVEFDTTTGKMVSNYLTTKIGWWPGCDAGSGLVGINPVAQSLEVLEPTVRVKPDATF